MTKLKYRDFNKLGRNIIRTLRRNPNAIVVYPSSFYQGKPVERGFTGTMRTIVMQKNNPDRLDMRYKTNKEWIKEQQMIKLVHDKLEDAKGELIIDFSKRLHKVLGF